MLQEEPKYLLKNDKYSLFIYSKKHNKAISIFKKTMEVNELNDSNITYIFFDENNTINNSINNEDTDDEFYSIKKKYNNILYSYANFGFFSISGINLFIYVSSKDFELGNNEDKSICKITNIQYIILAPDIDKRTEKEFDENIFIGFKKYIIRQNLYFSLKFNIYSTFDKTFIPFDKEDKISHIKNINFSYNRQYLYILENKDLIKYFTPVIQGYYDMKILIHGNQKYCFNFLLRAKNLEKSEINNLIEGDNDNQGKENKNEIKGSQNQKKLKDLIFEIDIYNYSFQEQLNNIYQNLFYVYSGSYASDCNFLKHLIKNKNPPEENKLEDNENAFLLISLLTDEKDSENFQRNFESMFKNKEKHILLNFEKKYQNADGIKKKFDEFQKKIEKEVGSYVFMKKIKQQKKILLIMTDNIIFVFELIKNTIEKLIMNFMNISNKNDKILIENNLINPLIEEYNTNFHEFINPYNRISPFKYETIKRKYNYVGFKPDEVICNDDEIKLFFLTYNVNGKDYLDIKDSFEELIFPKDIEKLIEKKLPDFFCIGIQEIVELNPLNVVILNNKDVIKRWERKISKTLKKRYNYILQFKESLVGILFLLYTKASECNYIKDAKKSVIKAGFIGAGNKGYIIYKMNYKNNNMAFCVAHLTAGEQDKERLLRIENLEKILNHKMDEKSEKFYMNDYYFILGDLNFRVKKSENPTLLEWSASIDENVFNTKKKLFEENNKNLNTRKRKRKKEIQKVFDTSNPEIVNEKLLYEFHNKFLEEDELNIFKKKIDKKYNMTENNISFPPTYKYFIDSDNYDISKKQPSWCDRILYKNSKNIKQLRYDRINVNCSDHKPVYGYFEINIKEKINKIINYNEDEIDNYEKEISVLKIDDYLDEKPDEI